MAKRIIDKSPDIIGFSIYIWNKKQTYSLIETIKNSLKLEATDMKLHQLIMKTMNLKIIK